MSRILKAILLLLPLVLLASIPAVALAETRNSDGDPRITAQQAAPSVSLAGGADVQVRAKLPGVHHRHLQRAGLWFHPRRRHRPARHRQQPCGSDGDSVYTFNVTPTSLGEVTVDIAAGVAADAQGNPNTAAPQLSLGIPFDFDGIGRSEAIAAILDYFAGLITRQQAIAVIVRYLAAPTEPEPGPMVMETLAPGEELMVEHPGGAMIEVPQGATGQENDGQLTVSIAEVEPPSGSIFTEGPVYDFTIEDQDGNEVDLREPVILHLPYPEGLDPGRCGGAALE